MVGYFLSATNRRSRAASWSIIAPPFIVLAVSPALWPSAGALNRPLEQPGEADTLKRDAKARERATSVRASKTGSR